MNTDELIQVADENKDKGLFVLTLLVALFALSGFKNSLDLYRIAVAGSFSFSLSDALSVFIVLLGISAYLFAVSQIKQSSNIKILKLFKVVNILANFFYTLAILSPLFIANIYISKALVKIISLSLKSVSSDWILGSVFVAVLGIVTGYLVASVTSKLIRDQYRGQKLEFEIDAYMTLVKAKELFNQKLWDETIIQSYKSIELYIRSKLAMKGIKTQVLPFKPLLDIAQSEQIVDNSDYKRLNEIRKLRNIVIHSNVASSKTQAVKALDSAIYFLKKVQRVKEEV